MFWNRSLNNTMTKKITSEFTDCMIRVDDPHGWLRIWIQHITSIGKSSQEQWAPNRLVDVSYRVVLFPFELDIRSRTPVKSWKRTLVDCFMLEMKSTKPSCHCRILGFWKIAPFKWQHPRNPQLQNLGNKIFESQHAWTLLPTVSPLQKKRLSGKLEQKSTNFEDIHPPPETRGLEHDPARCYVSLPEGIYI